MAALQEAIKRADERRIKRLNGRTTDENGILAHTDKWVQNLANLPAYANFRKPLQDEVTGLPYYMSGIHLSSSDADNAGDAPNGG